MRKVSQYPRAFKRAVLKTIKDEHQAYYARQLGPAWAVARARTGLSQEDVARTMQVGVERVRQWECGMVLPSWDQFWLLVSTLQLTLTLTPPAPHCRFCQTVVTAHAAIRPPQS